jgi:hypothetical protein
MLRVIPKNLLAISSVSYVPDAVLGANNNPLALSSKGVEDRSIVIDSGRRHTG